MSKKLFKDDIWKVIDSFFKDKGLIKHQIESFDDFINVKIYKIINELEPIEITYNLSSDNYIKHVLTFKNPILSKPQAIERNNDVTPLTPNEARLRSLTYESTLYINVSYNQYNSKNELLSSKTEMINFCNIPIMVGSSKCVTHSLNTKGKIELQECEYDQGGYFIINGNEKVLIAQERMATNSVYIFLNKNNNYVAEVRSIQEGDVKSANQVILKYVKPVKKNTIVSGNVIRVTLPLVKKEIPIIVLIKALGMTEGFESLVKDENLMYFESSIEESSIITTKEQARDYISKRSTYNLETPEKKNDFILKLLCKDILSHIGYVEENSPEMEDCFTKKIQFLSYMINKLLITARGRRELDDRDHWGNKRIDLASNLLGSLFRSSVSKVMKNIKMISEKYVIMGKNINLNDIKKDIITKDIRYSLSTGNWTVNKQKISKTGVSQVLNRLSYLSTLSHLRRVVAPIAKDGKSAKPRQLHNTSFGFMCVTGDTKVLLSDGITTKQIKDLREGECIISVSSHDLTEEPTKFYNYFKKENQDILRIKTVSGRELKCTKDHPLLIKNENGFIWKLAGDCTTKDRVVVKHNIEILKGEQTLLITEEDFIKKCPDNIQYLNELKEVNLVSKPITQDKVSILARLFGLSLSDGYLSNRDGNFFVEFYLGEEVDAYRVIDDISSLGLSHFSIKRTSREYVSRGRNIQVKTWDVLSSGCLASLLYLLGSFEGKKNKQNREIPDWIMKGSLQTKQNFLIGFQSGDGGYLSYQKNGDCYKRNLINTSQNCCKDYLENTVSYMTQYCNLFKEFDISCKVITREIENEKYCVGIDYQSSTENLKKYIDLICYYYSNHKQRRSKIVIEQVYSCFNTQNERQEKYNKVYDLNSKNIPHKEISEITNLSLYQIRKIISKKKNKLLTK